MGVTTLFLLIFLPLITNLHFTTAQPTCYESGNFTANSTYGKNRDLLLSSLASNITAPRFFRVTIGRDPDKVYATVLCQGDATTAECVQCVQGGTQKIMSNCPNQKEAIIWEDKCTVRCSDRNIFHVYETKPSQLLYIISKIPDNVEDQFHATLANLTSGIVETASVGSKGLKFAARKNKFRPLQWIYSLAECNPDLSTMLCRECLEGAISEFETCCGKYQGGVSHTPSCRFRYETYPFYNDDSGANVPDSSPRPKPPVVMPPSPSIQVPLGEGHSSHRRMVKTIVTIVLPVGTSVAVVGLVCAILHRRNPRNITEIADATECESEEFMKFNLATIKVATDDFSADNALGRGGFGSVYKGRLLNGQEIAVKRLDDCSGQGVVEFKNEILLLASLQHKNLVRLLGFCLENGERLLVYEYMPKGSLDHFLSANCRELDWEIRGKVIYGIARGILYLHEESRLRIIHLDLKAANVLLDEEMNPKIADFGLARLFVASQTRGNTERIAGTYGYMPPEYVFHGEFSVKNDIFSFGILILEIVTGKKNSSFHNQDQEENILSLAWRNWRNGTVLELVDTAVPVKTPREIIRCVHIGLLCVQENAVKRPSIASVVLMLNSVTVSLPMPSRPAFLVDDSTKHIEYLQNDDNLQFLRTDHSREPQECISRNEVTISELYPR